MSVNVLSNVDILSRAVQSSARKRKIDKGADYDEAIGVNAEDILANAVQASAKKSAKTRKTNVDENSSPNEVRNVRKALFCVDAVGPSSGGRNRFSFSSFESDQRNNNSTTSCHIDPHSEDNNAYVEVHGDFQCDKDASVPSADTADSYRDIVVNPDYKIPEYDLKELKMCVLNSIARILQEGTAEEVRYPGDSVRQLYLLCSESILQSMWQILVFQLSFDVHVYLLVTCAFSLC